MFSLNFLISRKIFKRKGKTLNNIFFLNKILKKRLKWWLGTQNHKNLFKVGIQDQKKFPHPIQRFLEFLSYSSHCRIERFVQKRFKGQRFIEKFKRRKWVHKTFLSNQGQFKEASKLKANSNSGQKKKAYEIFSLSNP